MKKICLSLLPLIIGSSLFISLLRNVQADTLFSASAQGHNGEVRRLLRAGVSPDVRGEKGTALVYAAANGHLSTVKLLLHGGAHLHACDEQSVLFEKIYNKALWEAASNGHAKVVGYLLDKGAAINGRDDNGYNPLLCAASSKHWATVRLLLAYGADPDYQTRHYQHSALKLAAAFGHNPSVRALLRHGADINASDMYDHTALWWAHRNHHYSTVRLLKRFKAK